jgi:type IX secretion system PorP/SprF family membrane protein
MKNLILGIIILLSFSAFSQQVPISAMYPYNTSFINPAEVGTKKGTQVQLGHRQQWVGFVGSPNTTFLSAQRQLNSKMGIGGNVSLDKIAFIQRINANASYSYKLHIDNKSKIRFGLSAGIMKGTLDLSTIQADDMSDIVLTSAPLKMTFDATFGMTYTFDRDLNIGIALPQLLGTKASVDIVDGNKYNLVRHSNVYISYKLKVDEQFEFIPLIMIRNAQKKNSQVEVFGNIKYNNKVWGGIGHRSNSVFILNMGMQLIDKLSLTYAFEFSSSGVASNTSGTHEIMLSLNLNKAPEVPEEEEEGGEEEPTERKTSTSF